MKNPIVVGAVDTGSSKAALAWAMERAAQRKLPVLFVHAVDTRWLDASFAAGEMIRAAAHEFLSKNAAYASELEPSVQVKTLLFPGSPGYALRKRSKGASMVVIGTGHHWPGGPVADRALQIAAVALCPVAVVGDNDMTGRRGVVVGADGSEESRQAVSFAAAEADGDNQDLTVVHAVPAPPHLQRALPAVNFAESVLDEERVVLAETVAGLAENYPGLVIRQALVSTNEPAETLKEAAANATLLVLGSRGRGNFKRLLLGSTAHTVLRSLPCPTVITRVRPARHGSRPASEGEG